MNLPCSLETRHSEKSGRDYRVFVIKLTDNVEKVIFPEQAELELVDMYVLLQKKKNNK